MALRVNIHRFLFQNPKWQTEEDFWLLLIWLGQSFFVLKTFRFIFLKFPATEIHRASRRWVNFRRTSVFVNCQFRGGDNDEMPFGGIEMCSVDDVWTERTFWLFINDGMSWKRKMDPKNIRGSTPIWCCTLYLFHP